MSSDRWQSVDETSTGGSSTADTPTDAASEQARKRNSASPLSDAASSGLDGVRRWLDPSRRVWIRGRRGTGRRRLAERIHLTSPRRDSPFQAIDCTRCSPLTGRRIFLGEHRSAFMSGRSTTRKYLGLFESIGSGTLYLEELEKLGADLQKILASVIESGYFTPLGSSIGIPFEGGVIGSTHEELDTLVASGLLVTELRDQLSARRVETRLA